MCIQTILFVIIFTIGSTELFADRGNVEKLINQALANTVILKSKQAEEGKALKKLAESSEKPSEGELLKAFSDEQELKKEIEKLSKKVGDINDAIQKEVGDLGLEDLKELVKNLGVRQETFNSLQSKAKKELSLYNEGSDKDPLKTKQLTDLVLVAESNVETIAKIVTVVNEALKILESKPTNLPTFAEYLDMDNHGKVISTGIYDGLDTKQVKKEVKKALKERKKYRSWEFDSGVALALDNIKSYIDKGKYILPPINEWPKRGFVKKYNRVYDELYKKQLDAKKEELIKEGKVRGS